MGNAALCCFMLQVGGALLCDWQGTSTPPNHTVTTGHFPTAFSYTVDIFIFEPLLSPPVTWLLMKWGVSLVTCQGCGLPCGGPLLTAGLSLARQFLAMCPFLLHLKQTIL